ncbi:MAG: YbaN family protein [Acidimicrobiia bacterium]|nr:YbaN family protein [Acidimicrobiia bacterium]
MRPLYLLAGLTCVGVGWLGLIMPGLPGTVFFIVAAWFFSRSSPRLERWVLGLPGVGQLVADYRNGLGMPLRAKKLAIGCIVAACIFSAGFAIDPLWIRVAVAVTGLVGVWYVGRRVPTRETVLRQRQAEAVG